MHGAVASSPPVPGLLSLQQQRFSGGGWTLGHHLCHKAEVSCLIFVIFAALLRFDSFYIERALITENKAAYYPYCVDTSLCALFSRAADLLYWCDADTTAIIYSLPLIAQHYN